MIVRHWFPVITAGATLALLLAVAAVHRQDTSPLFYPSAKTVDEEREPAQSTEAYQHAVQEILRTYEVSNNANVAYDTLLYLTRIPASMKDVHFGLVASFGKIAVGDETEGLRRLDALRAEYSWLVL